MPNAQDVVPARKRGRPTEAERAQRLDDILGSAVRLFVDRGFESVTLDDIAAAAHVTKRTIYTHIGDRTEVFLAAVERLGDRALRDVRPEAGLDELAQHVVRALYSDDAIGLHRLVIGESRRFPQLAARFYDEGPRRYIAALRSRLPADDAAAETLFGLLLGEPHRRRLLGLDPEPSPAAAVSRAREALALLRIAPTTPEDAR